MRHNRKLVLATSVVLFAAFTLAFGGSPERSAKSNSYYLYTKALTTTDAGVVAVPSRFKRITGIDSDGKVIVELEPKEAK